MDGEIEDKTLLRIPRGGREDNIKVDLEDIGFEGMLNLFGVEYRQVTGFCENGNGLSGCVRVSEQL
jgi:hypothetical protein